MSLFTEGNDVSEKILEKIFRKCTERSNRQILPILSLQLSCKFLGLYIMNTGIILLKKSHSVYCPAWIYDIASARVASEFLHSEMPLESFATKYAQGLNESYSDVSAESLVGAAQGMLEFLAEIEAGENAALLLSNFTYYRLYYSGVAIPRKMKPMFGSIEDAQKQKEYSEQLAIKAFRAYVFRLRSNPEDAPSSDWRLEDDEHIGTFGDLVRKQVSILDAL